MRLPPTAECGGRGPEQQRARPGGAQSPPGAVAPARQSLGACVSTAALWAVAAAPHPATRDPRPVTRVPLRRRGQLPACSWVGPAGAACVQSRASGTGPDPSGGSLSKQGHGPGGTAPGTSARWARTHAGT